MTKSNLKGFTLIELLIVIVIIGILAVALIPRLTGSQATARDTARKATLNQIATVVSAYVNQESSPVAITTSNTPVAIDGTMVSTVSSYGNIPTAGPNGTPFYIARNGTTNEYVISTQLEKGQGNVTNTGAASWSIMPTQTLSSSNMAHALRTP